MRQSIILTSATLFVLLSLSCSKPVEDAGNGLLVHVSFKAGGVQYSFSPSDGFIGSPIIFNQSFQDSSGENFQCPNRGTQFFDPSFSNFQQFTIQFTNFCFNSIEFQEDPSSKVFSMFHKGEYDLTNGTFGVGEGVFMQFSDNSGLFYTSQSGLSSDSFVIDNTGYIPETQSTDERIIIQGHFNCQMYDGWSTLTEITDGEFLMEIQI